jgi:hypothetical protein
VNAIDAYHLPGLRNEDVLRWEERPYGDGEVVLRFPVLTPELLESLVARLRLARAERLAGRPVASVVRALGEAAARLAREDDPCRVLAERALPAITGFSPPMVRLILDRMIADWQEEALWRLLRSELGDPEVLDDFRPRADEPDPAPRTLMRACGPDLAFQIFSGNVPGVAVTALIRSLLVKAATLGKTASGEPLLPVLFARALAAVDHELGECLAVTYWPGGEEALEAVALRAADTVVVYGGREVEEQILRRIPPGKRLVVHGARLSLGLIGRPALARDVVRRTAAEAAWATAVFDQQGCVSPHVFYVERGGDTPPERFAGLLAAELDRLEKELPRGRITAAEAARIHQVRGAAEFRALGGQDVQLHAGPGTQYTVIYEANPEFAPSCLNRVVWVKPVDDLLEAVAYVSPYGSYLQTVGVAGAGPRLQALADRLAQAGASRITDLTRMPFPPPTWRHDGQQPLRELIRWVDLEVPEAPDS